jgi:hypothetical protein
MAITSSTRHRQALLVLAAATAAIPAAAEEQPAGPRGEARSARPAITDPVRLAIGGLKSGQQVRVVWRPERVSEWAVAASCTEDCELKLKKGAYTLIASRGDDHRSKQVELTSSQILKMGQWDGGIRAFGTVMGITGIVVGAMGAFITVASIVSPSPGPDDEDLDNSGTLVALLGVAGLAAGTGLMIGGFSLAAKNRAPSMDLERMPTTHPPAGGAAGISLSGKF